jgi:hypothetical protein
MKAQLQKLIPKRLAQKLRIVRYEARLPALSTSLAKPHGLPGELIVSLTSYPGRFDTLHLCIRSLLDQTIKADRVILWISAADAAAVPRKVRALESSGLEVRLVADTRSYKKLVDALAAFPDAFIATADDDIYYSRDWLETLVAGVVPGLDVVLCHRAHRISPADGRLPPYMSWQWDVQDEASRQPSIDLLATGVGGILYPPRVLHADTTDSATFMDLCPRGDDLWFYWMARRTGATYRKVGGPFVQSTLPGSQEESLFNQNAGAAYDEQISRLSAKYGLPNHASFEHS